MGQVKNGKGRRGERAEAKGKERREGRGKIT